MNELVKIFLVSEAIRVGRKSKTTVGFIRGVFIVIAILAAVFFGAMGLQVLTDGTFWAGVLA